jgi:hypothetical protein
MALWEVPIKARQYGFGKLKDTFGGGGDGGGGTASETFAQITRQQWSDYLNTFVPIENQLIKYATDPGVVSSAMSEASGDVNAAFDAQQGATDRRLQGLGVTLSPEEQAARTKSTGLARSLTDVGAQNNAAALTRQRQDSILGNPAPKVPTQGVM